MVQGSYFAHVDTIPIRGRRDRMVVGFTTTCSIRAYHHSSCEFEPRSWRGVLDTTLCDKVCQSLATGRWFSPVSSTNETDRHDITEILLKVALIKTNYINEYSTTCKKCQIKAVTFIFIYICKCKVIFHQQIVVLTTFEVKK